MGRPSVAVTITGCGSTSWAVGKSAGNVDSTARGAISPERRGASFVAAGQWHPEFHDPADRTLIDDGPILADFLDAARTARKT